jgi:RecA/RadA recombinase
MPDKIIELRKILAERFPQEAFPPQTFIQTGLTCFDQKLGGGLLRGALTQVVTPNLSSGSTLVLHEIVEAMNLAAQFVALVDGTNCFEPSKNTDLLLWIRCQNAHQAVKATDLLLRDGNVALTILDLKQNDDRELRKIPATTWYRLRRVAEAARTTLLLMTRHQLIASVFPTLQNNHQLEFDDLSRFYFQILLSIAPELIPRKSLSEYQYAQA